VFSECKDTTANDFVQLFVEKKMLFLQEVSYQRLKIEQK